MVAQKKLHELSKQDLVGLESKEAQSMTEQTDIPTTNTDLF